MEDGESRDESGWGRGESGEEEDRGRRDEKEWVNVLFHHTHRANYHLVHMTSSCFLTAQSYTDNTPIASSLLISLAVTRK